jgi:hypothetical protein
LHARIPVDLLGRLLDHGKASAYAVHLLAIKLFKGAGYVLNKKTCAPAAALDRLLGAVADGIGAKAGKRLNGWALLGKRMQGLDEHAPDAGGFYAAPKAPMATASLVDADPDEAKLGRILAIVEGKDPAEGKLDRIMETILDAAPNELAEAKLKHIMVTLKREDVSAEQKLVKVASGAPAAAAPKARGRGRRINSPLTFRDIHDADVAMVLAPRLRMMTDQSRLMHFLGVQAKRHNITTFACRKHHGTATSDSGRKPTAARCVDHIVGLFQDCIAADAQTSRKRRAA